MTAFSKQQRARLYIYKAKNCETFLYTKIHILFTNQDNLRYVLYTKVIHFMLRGFSRKCLSWHLYTKSRWI